MSPPEMIRQMLEYSTPAMQTPDGCWTAEYHLPLSFLGFKGHFTDYPVLPAMLQLAMVRLLIENAIGEPCSLDVRSAKFSAPVHPDAVLSVQVTRGNPIWKAKITVRQADSNSFETAAVLSVHPKKLESVRHEA